MTRRTVVAVWRGGQWRGRLGNVDRWFRRYRPKGAHRKVTGPVPWWRRCPS